MAYEVAGPGYLKLDAVRNDQSAMLEGDKGSSVFFLQLSKISVI